MGADRGYGGCGGHRGAEEALLLLYCAGCTLLALYYDMKEVFPTKICLIVTNVYTTVAMLNLLERGYRLADMIVRMGQAIFR